MKKVLGRKFFERAALLAAQDLLGKFLVRRSQTSTDSLMITEVEAYDGPLDKASHAHRGRTKRTEAMFGEAGRFYIYLIYGMYHMLNIVTGPKDYPAAILIRGCRSQSSKVARGLTSGPGKLTKFLKINRKFNGLRAVPSEALAKEGLWFEDRGVKIKKNRIKRTPRIGVSYAGPIWSKKHYRFVMKN